MDALTLGPSVSLSVRVYLSACSLSVCLSVCWFMPALSSLQAAAFIAVVAVCHY